METHTSQNEPSLGELIKQLRDDTTVLVKDEIALAKTELTENAKKTGRNIGILVGGALVAFVALIMLLMGLAKAVAAGFIAMELSPTISEVLGYLIVAVIIGIVAGVLISKALQVLKNDPLTPEKTIETLKDDKQWAKKKIK